MVENNNQVSLYGKIAIKKSFCIDCNGMYFVQDNILQCCGKSIMNQSINKVKRECNDTYGKKLSSSFKNKILSIQENKCIMCGIDLRQTWYCVKKNGKVVTIIVEFDHFIPQCFIANSETENIYAMCNICNGIKSSNMFNSISDCRNYVMERRRKLGYMEVYSKLELKASSYKWTKK